MHRDRALLEDTVEHAPDASVMTGQQLGTVGNDAQFEAGARLLQLARAIVQRQRQLDAPSTTADDCQVKIPLALEQLPFQPLPGINKTIDRLDRELKTVGLR